MAVNRLPSTPTNLSVEGFMPILFKGESDRCKFLSQYTNIDGRRRLNQYFDQAMQKGSIEVDYDENSSNDQLLMSLMSTGGERILDAIKKITVDDSVSGVSSEFCDYLSEHNIGAVNPKRAIITSNGGVVLIYEGVR